MLRFLIVAVTVIGFLILSIPVLLIEWIIGRFRPDLRDISSLRIVQGVFRLILWETGAKIDVIGYENVPKDQPVLYIGNHRSYFDVLLTYCRTPGLTGYVAKDSMEKIPLLSIWMKRLYCLFLNREDIRQGLKTILTGIDQIKNGISMCIFPEGTRNKGEGMLPFKEGSMKMAEKTGCPIIPMAITNSAGIFEDHIPFIRPVHVILEYGTPIYPKELSREEKKFLGAYTQNRIADMLNAHTGLLEDKKGA
ncbi:MAG: lysophospholipid acyltransferase family protein [Eubacteriales bacterium]|nr:lysophospholipid acyltransferase family protein [Eubacteriales bacterium]